MNMPHRISVIALALSLTTGCSTVDTSMSDLNARLAHARADAETSATANDYSQFLIARFASLINDPEEAAEKYALVARSRPDDATITERAVFSALLANDFALAHSISNRAAPEIRRETSLTRMSLAADALARGKPAAVAPLLEGEDPGMFNSLIMSSLKAWALFDQGQTGEAQVALLDASAGDAYLDSLVLNLLGLMEVASGEDKAALETFAKLRASSAMIAATVESYARLLANSGRADEAIDVLEAFRKEAGHNPVVTDLIGRISRAEPVAIKRMSAREGAALSIYIPAAALAEQAQNDLPGVYYAMALRLDPDLHAARALWADALDNAGRREESIEMLETIPASSPYYTSARGQLAWALRRDEQNDVALELVYKTLAGNPDRDLKIQMADLLRSLGRDGEAVKVLSELIDADETAGSPDWRLYYARGSVYERIGKWPLAEDDLQLALGLNPNSPDVMNYLGYSWIDRNENLEAGLDLIRKALTLRPNSGAITDSLGWAYYKVGDYEKSVGYLERAAELEPGLAEINDHLGDAYWMSGRQLEARYQWQRAISVSDDERDIDRIQRKLLTGPATAQDHARLP